MISIPISFDMEAFVGNLVVIGIVVVGVAVTFYVSLLILKVVKYGRTAV